MLLILTIAFDAVSRNILIDKLIKYGLVDVEVAQILNELPGSNVAINRTKSTWRPDTSGIHQGYSYI